MFPWQLHDAARQQLGVGNFAEANRLYADLLACDPTNAEAHAHYALSLLSSGDYGKGFLEFEWRLQCGVGPAVAFDVPRWDGSEATGQTILLYPEQGIGDAIQMLRYAPLIKNRGLRTMLVCPPETVRVFATAKGLDLCVPNTADSCEPFQCHAPVMSMPAILRTIVETVPAVVPYLSADETLVDRWRRILPTGFKVGICWRGGSSYRHDAHRSFALCKMAPLADVPGVSFICLQKGAIDADFLECGFSSQIQIIQDLDASAAFVDTAAIMNSLDLVITCDSAIGHLAGALGIPVWLALPYISDWRWIVGRENTPWYPTMRLFRQEKLGEWAPVFQRMAAALVEICRK